LDEGCAIPNNGLQARPYGVLESRRKVESHIRRYAVERHRKTSAFLIFAAAFVLLIAVGCGEEGSKPYRGGLSVIPFEELGPRWTKWREAESPRGKLGYYARQNGDVVDTGINIKEGQRLSWDEYGTLIPPTADGSILSFETNGMKFKWINDVVFVSKAGTVLYFGVQGDHGGLVHLLGEGSWFTSNGIETSLIETNASIELALHLVTVALAGSPEDSEFVALKKRIEEKMNASR